MMVGALLSVVTFLALMIFHPFWPFLIIRFLQGIAIACMDTAAFAAIISVTPLAYRARALGYFMLAPSLALALAAPFGMFIINQYDFPVLFLSGAGLALCALFLSWKVGKKEIAIPDKTAPSHSASFINLKIVAPAATSFLQLFVWGSVSAFFPLYAIQCGVTNPGLFFTAMAIMMVAGRLFGGRIMDTCNKEKLVVTFLPSVVVVLIVLSLSKTLPMFIFVGAFWGIGAAFLSPCPWRMPLTIQAPLMVLPWGPSGNFRFRIRPWTCSDGDYHTLHRLPGNVSLSRPYLSHQYDLFSVLCKKKRQRVSSTKNVIMLRNGFCKILRNLSASLVRASEYPDDMDNVPCIVRNPDNP